MHRIIRTKAYEAKHGPHFDEEHARNVRQASATADASLPVGLSDDNAENNTTQSMLRNALQEEVQAGDLQLNFRYLIYYNKCNNTYQLVNAYPTNIAAQAA